MGSFNHHLLIGVDQQADMTGGAGGGCKILADGPGHGLEIPGGMFAGKNVAVFTGAVNLISRHIGTHVAFFAGIGFACYFNRKGVSGVAGRTGTHAAVQVNAPHALIGPAFDNWKFQFSGGFSVTGFSAGQLQFGAVTVITGFRPGGIVGGRSRHFTVLKFS